jgi:pilus assembly protein CpaC
MLQGTVSSAPAAAKAMRIAEAYAPDGVENGLSVGPSQQVMLEVIFAEVNKTFGKAVGINSGVGYASDDFSFSVVPGGGASTTQTPVTQGGLPAIASAAFGSVTGAGIFATLGAFDFFAALELAEDKGLAKTLAKPNLVVLSGDTASFLAGGEFPIQVTQPGTDNFTIEFKEFGVSLSFTPTVLSDGLISLRVRPEVSNIATFPEGTGVNTRRADTTVELRDGQSFSIAGLYQNDYSNDIAQTPWIGDVPVLGALFRSTEFQERESELVIIITPRLVQPAKSIDDLKLPTDIYHEPSEADLFLLGKIMGEGEGAAAVSSGGGGGLSGNSGYILK